MSYIRFNHVFFTLMALSFISAFIINPRITSRPQKQVQGIFAPVSSPIRIVAGKVHGAFSRQEPRYDGSPGQQPPVDQVIEENNRLRIEVASLKEQFDRMQLREQERAAVGDVRKLCTPVRVTGGDSGLRLSLMLNASTFDEIRENMPVLYPGGIAGRISRAGVGGVSVLLVTDGNSKLLAMFARYVARADGTPEFQVLSRQTALVNGSGKGDMFARITKRDSDDMGLRPGDWVVLNETDAHWRPDSLNGYRIGYVDAINPTREPGFVEIRIRPEQDLMKLQEVMVMNKEKG